MKISRCCLVVFIVILSRGAAVAQLNYKQLSILYDSPWTYKNLQMIPIKFKPQGEGEKPAGEALPRAINFSEALLKRKIKVQEMQYENGADVNWLQITNHSKQNVIVQGGEVLEGGKQDRMVGETKFIAPGATDYVHVYCVEKRRWSDKPKEFRTNGIANREMQKAMNTTNRQSEVWKEIDKEFKAQNKTSETWSFLELYNSSAAADTGYINFFTRKYVESDSNLAGFIFITGDHIMSAEVFAASSLLDVTFANMLNSYVQSVVSNGAKPVLTPGPVKTFMNKILTSEEEQKIYVTAHGQLHKNGEKVIHLIAYPE